ncbi:MAG TPA: hypothetical protein VD929_00565 [Caulobacteraceae bacterium]|nr:hypothetical protein [Caulobacteraceae bacterium]
MEGAFALAGSGAAGALFGALGSVLNRAVGLFEMREKRRDRQLEMAHEKDRWGHETALHELQARARAVETERELALAEQALERAAAEGSWAGLRASVEAEARTPAGPPWVNAVRALTRPGLTVLLWAMFFVLFLLSLDGRLPAATAGEVAPAFVNAITFAATTALAWWFGDRAPGARGRG